MTLATTYLYMGLWTHETVSNQSPRDLASTQKQQLTVLAGDFYSSLFYRVLGEEREQEAIARLAKMASLIQEKKMRVYLEEGILVSEEWVGNRLCLGLVELLEGEGCDLEKWAPLFQDNHLQRGSRDLHWLKPEIRDELEYLLAEK